MNSYDQDDLVRVWFRFKNTLGALTDPTTVTVKVENPSGTTTTYTFAGAQVIKDSVGVYYYDINANAAGVWYYRGIGTGLCQAAGQDMFRVAAARPA